MYIYVVCICLRIDSISREEQNMLIVVPQVCSVNELDIILYFIYYPTIIFALKF